MKKQRPLPESEEGKKIRRKYLRALDRCVFFEDYQELAVKFKEDLKVFFVNERKLQCTLMLLLALNLNAQEGVIVAAGNGSGVSYTIGNNLVELQIPIVEDEVSLGVPKFEIEKPVQIVKPNKKLTIFDKIKILIKKLFKK